MAPASNEINLNHVPDALAAADYAVLLKRIVKSVARANDLDATFMAKPYGMQAGSGMHVHFSVLDQAGRNIYVGEEGQSERLMHSVGGLLETWARAWRSLRRTRTAIAGCALPNMRRPMLLGLR